MVESTPSERDLARQAAALLRDGFREYNRQFAEVTQRARQRFEHRDWAGARGDAVERIGLYDRCVGATSDELSRMLGDDGQDRSLWNRIRDGYAELIASEIDQELFKTFFNTISRRFHKIRGVSPDIEFVALDIEPIDRIAHPVARHAYSVMGELGPVLERVLADYPFDSAYAHRRECAQRIADSLEHQLTDWGTRPIHAIELMQTVFYRERRA